MTIAIAGGGIAGLSLALALHQRGKACTVYEAVAEVREIGVGITLLPHAMRVLAALGVQDALESVAIENAESVFFNRFGQRIYSEARGRLAGYAQPELGIHRGRLHQILYRAVVQRLGANAVRLAHRCTGVAQSADGVTVHFAPSSNGQEQASVQSDVLIACDGVNSQVRRQFYPDEKLAFTGINTWRGVSVHPPILSGRSYLRIGSVETGKMVIYPIADNVDGQGSQLINWVAEIRQPGNGMNDWNRAGNANSFIDVFKDWRFDWLDVPALIRKAGHILEYPMVDKDPVPRWTFGRVSLAGDAAHPMYPRGSNGAAQALIDAETLAEQLALHADPLVGLQAYEELRRDTTARVVHTNRSVPPDYIIMKVDELSGGQPFNNLADLISAEELRAISEHYKSIAGFSVENMKS